MRETDENLAEMERWRETGRGEGGREGGRGKRGEGVKEGEKDIERVTLLSCRYRFFEFRLLKKKSAFSLSHRFFAGDGCREP